MQIQGGAGVLPTSLSSGSFSVRAPAALVLTIEAGSRRVARRFVLARACAGPSAPCQVLPQRRAGGGESAGLAPASRKTVSGLQCEGAEA